MLAPTMQGGGVPMCTLRNFPHLIDHCIEWARAQFEDLFVSSAQAAEKFLQGPDAFIAKTKARMRHHSLANAPPCLCALAPSRWVLPCAASKPSNLLWLVPFGRAAQPPTG